MRVLKISACLTPAKAFASIDCSTVLPSLPSLFHNCIVSSKTVPMFLNCLVVSSLKVMPKPVKTFSTSDIDCPSSSKNAPIFTFCIRVNIVLNAFPIVSGATLVTSLTTVIMAAI